MSTRRVPRRRTYKKVNGSKTMHRVARQEAKKVIKREIETKFFEGSTSRSAIAGVQTIDDNGRNFVVTKDYSDVIIDSTNGTTIKQGIGSAEYIGLHINPVYLAIHFSIVNATGMLAEVYNTVTIMITQGIGAFTYNQVSTENQLTYNDSYVAPLGFIPREYNDRYRILYRKRFTVDSDDPVRTGNIKISGKKLRKISFTNALGITEAGPLCISVVSDSGSEPHPQVFLGWRLYYKDA